MEHGVRIFGHIPFSMRWDTVTVRYSGIQLDTARYVRIQLNTVRYSGIRVRDAVDLLQNG